MSVTGFAVDSIEYFTYNFIQFRNFRIHFHTCGLFPSLSTVFERFAVGSTEYSLCKFRQLACFRLTIHKSTHLPSPDTVYDIVCRWLDHMLTFRRPTMSAAAFGVGSIEYSFCNFRQFGNFRIPFRTYDHLSSLLCCTRGVERK